MAPGTYAQRIARLERCREGLRAQLALLAPGSRYAAVELINLIEYVSETLVILRQRASRRAEALEAVSQQAPTRHRPDRRPAAHASITPSAQPVGPRRVPASFRTIRDEGVELETTWSGDAWRYA